MENPENTAESKSENIAGPPSAYAACEPGALPPAEVAFVRGMQAKFLSAFAEQLTDALEIKITSDLAAVQAVPCATFQQSVEEGGFLLKLDAQPVQGQALIALSAGLLGRLLRRLLGAPAGAVTEPRIVTEIELHILGDIFEAVAREMTSAWVPVGIAFRLTPPGAAEAEAGQGTLLSFECRLNFEEAQETFHVAAPAFLARLAFLRAPAASAQAASPARDAIFNALRRAQVPVEAILTGSTLRMQDLLAMEPGQVLMLAQPAGAPVECRIGGKPKWKGEWITQNNRQSLMIL